MPNYVIGEIYTMLGLFLAAVCKATVLKYII